MFNLLYKIYKEKFYDKLVEEYIGCVPSDVREPALEFLADRKVLFEKFLSIQAYHIQKARILSKKSSEFYDGALMIIRALLAAVSRKVTERTPVSVSKVDENVETEKQLASINEFLKEGIKI